LRDVARVASFVTIALGCTGLLGWQLDLPRLSSIVTGHPKMVPTTAVGLVLSGSALLLLTPEEHVRWRRWLGGVMALLVLLTGLAILVEHVSGMDLGADLVPPFRAHPLVPAYESFPALAAPPAALALVLVSTSALMLALGPRWVSWAFDVSATAAGMIGYLSLTAHAYGAAGPHRLPTDPATGVALNTALGLTLLAVALLCSHPERGVMALVTSSDAGGFAARRLLPAALGAPLVFGLLVLFARRAGLLLGSPSEQTLLVASSATMGGALVLITSASLDRAASAQRRLLDELLRLEAVQGRLAALVESSNDGIIAMTPEGIIVSWNAACERIYGYSSEEMVGRSITSLVPPEGMTELQATLQQVRRGERINSVETSRVRKDGSRVEVEITTSPVLAADGHVSDISAIIRSIGARKESEREIACSHERERRLREQIEALGNASEAISEAVAMLPETEVNAVLHTILLQAQTITGARYAALGIGNDPERPFQPWLWSGISPHDAAALGRPPRPVGLLGIVACQGRTVRTSGIAQSSAGVVLPPGHPRITTFLGVPIRYHGRAVGNLYLSGKRDASEFTEDDQRTVEILALRAGLALETARAYREEALAKSWLQGVIDGIPESVLLADEHGRVSYNPAASALVCEDVTGEDGAGAPLRLDLRRPTGERLSWREQPLARALHEGTTVTGIELSLHCWPGQTLPMLVSASPLRDRALRTVGAVCVLQDVTGLKQLEHLREEWTAVVAHDLRQPLNMIAMATAVLEHFSLDTTDPRALKAIGRIRTATARLVAMIGDLLDTSRIEAQKLTLRREPTDVPHLVRDIVDAIIDGLDGHRVVVSVHGEPARASVDPARIEQVLVNLLSNAAKYGEPGSDIAVEVVNRITAIEIAVTNRGAGLRPEEQAKLFTRFYRAQPGCAERGLGLGLYICKGLVEAHGGRIWVESIPGATTTFHFTLPLSTP
jgi:PAS domain S-box-containing protein